jgi:hypothetical protein
VITITMAGGPMSGASRVQDTVDDIVFAEYEVTPKVSIRPAELLRTQGPIFHRYTFSSWLVQGESASYVYAGGL